MSATFGAIVLAAGTSSRMGDVNKLLAPLGERSVLGWAVDAALGSMAKPVVVVVGHRADEVRGTLPGSVWPVLNPLYASGLASSLRTGIDALPEGLDGAVVLLGDMPYVARTTVDALLEAWRPGRICVATHRGTRGNPVLWCRSFFDEMRGLTGDRGARSLIDAHPEAVVEVACDAAVLHDLDTPDDLDRARNES